MDAEQKSSTVKVKLKPFTFSNQPKDYRQTAVLYRHYNGNKLLYVGITDYLQIRMSQHIHNSPWFSQVTHTTYERGFRTRGELETAETLAIRRENPRYNKRR